MTDAREFLLQRLHEDLIGPMQPDEEIPTTKPSDRYLTGILFPQESSVPPAEDESLGVAGTDSEEKEEVALTRTKRPSSMGISFAVRGEGGAPAVRARIRCGLYRPLRKEEGAAYDWARTEVDFTTDDLLLGGGRGELTRDLAAHGLPGGSLYVQWTTASGAISVTVALVNRNESRLPDGTRKNFHDLEAQTFFQVELSIEAATNSRLVARASWRRASDEDGRAAELIYRKAREAAVGHTCSAEWEESDDLIHRVRTSWIPRNTVHAMSAAGANAFKLLGNDSSLKPLSAAWIAAQTDVEKLCAGLDLLPRAYATWIEEQRARIDDELLEGSKSDQAHTHLDICLQACGRMRAGVELLRNDEKARTAFRLAAQAMAIQRRWTKNEELRWRPFQLGFQLLSLASLADRGHADRETMDLLWFPTGGGKTEAYLGLIAFTLFHRRLREPVKGAGVGAFMRYTLRLLTLQQFERAAALVLACEHLRRGHSLPPGLAPMLGDTRFSVGLWVGQATPSTVQEAHAARADAKEKNPRQITNCPCCRRLLVWGEPFDAAAYNVTCRNDDCEFAKNGGELPILTVDEDVYGQRPSLLIGTIDKFAQVVRKAQTERIFGRGEDPVDPPDLILQDELHLISGPLGTIAGLYETAIDVLCTGAGRPKIIGSTATIRRAHEQVNAIFARDTFQFPPPGLDAADSGFAVEDRSVPGRLYAAVTTTGRSAKFTLQAVAASLLQAASQLPEKERDWYWTLVAYFNSLRELGGAVALLMDDVHASMQQFAQRRAGEEVREIVPPEELTSRATSIRDVLNRLEKPAGDPESVDALLSSNMISVGVDVARLGLMLVNGQPKTVAEYIQATSRVGRTHPGLVVGIYNDNKPRDRAHYETFNTWHDSLYREVEATSVTPFAPRAQDRALHAVLVALARHLAKGLQHKPSLGATGRKQLENLADLIVRRAERVEKGNTEEISRLQIELTRLISDWEERNPPAYWDDRPNYSSLLISAEQAAALQANAGTHGNKWPTLNSMRGVEPSTNFVLRENLVRRGNNHG